MKEQGLGRREQWHILSREDRLIHQVSFVVRLAKIDTGKLYVRSTLMPVMIGLQ